MLAYFQEENREEEKPFYQESSNAAMSAIMRLYQNKTPYEKSRTIVPDSDLIIEDNNAFWKYLRYFDQIKDISIDIKVDDTSHDTTVSLIQITGEKDSKITSSKILDQTYISNYGLPCDIPFNPIPSIDFNIFYALEIKSNSSIKILSIKYTGVMWSNSIRKEYHETHKGICTYIPTGIQSMS